MAFHCGVMKQIQDHVFDDKDIVGVWFDGRTEPETIELNFREKIDAILLAKDDVRRLAEHFGLLPPNRQ